MNVRCSRWTGKPCLRCDALGGGVCARYARGLYISSMKRSPHILKGGHASFRHPLRLGRSYLCYVVCTYCSGVCRMKDDIQVLVGGRAVPSHRINDTTIPYYTETNRVYSTRRGTDHDNSALVCPPCCRSRSMHAVWFQNIAQSSAVSPSLFCACTSAPAPISALHTVA